MPEKKFYKKFDVYRTTDGDHAVAYAGETAWSNERLVGRAKMVLKSPAGSEWRRKHYTADEDVLVSPEADVIFCGCHRLPAMRTFRALAKALGYELED